LQSSEFRRIQVAGCYSNLLHRAPDATGLSDWVTSNLNTAAIILGFEASAEFYINGRQGHCNSIPAPPPMPSSPDNGWPSWTSATPLRFWQPLDKSRQVGGKHRHLTVYGQPSGIHYRAAFHPVSVR